MPSENGDSGAPGQSSNESSAAAGADESVMKSNDYVDNGETNPPSTPNGPNPEKEPRTRKASKSIEPFDQAEREEMERLLQELRGHLGAYPVTIVMIHELI